MLTMLLGATELVSTRGRSGLRSLALLLSPLALLATPYGPIDTARYYHLLLVDPPFGRELVTEWRRSDPSWDTLAFYLLAALTLAAVVWGRRRLTLFDMAALGLTFAGAVLAIRGIPWFALSCLVLVPVALGPALEGRTKRVPRALRPWTLLRSGRRSRRRCVSLARARRLLVSEELARRGGKCSSQLAHYARDARLRDEPGRGLDSLAHPRATRPARL